MIYAWELASVQGSQLLLFITFLEKSILIFCNENGNSLLMKLYFFKIILVSVVIRKVIVGVNISQFGLSPNRQLNLLGISSCGC